MSGETNLSILLKNMNPILHKMEYVFCTFSHKQTIMNELDPVCVFKEKEGTTMIILKKQADKFSIPYDFIFKMITLTIHSSLEAVGFLAAITTKLAQHGISVNPVSAYYHDHLFIPVNKADEAMSILKEFSK